MKKHKSRSLLSWFRLVFIIFTIVILAATGVVSYNSQLRNYKVECEKNIRHIGEYLTSLMKNEGDDFAKYQEYYMNHYREMRIDYDFNEYEQARIHFVKLFSEKYPGQALGVDIAIEDTDPDVQMAYFTFKHEYWLLTFEKAREIFKIPYTYYLVMADPRERTESLKDDQDPKQSVTYMIDGERTLDKENSDGANKYLYLGDTYYNPKDTYGLMWSTWESGIRQDGYIEWDNAWGHTYGYYTPLVINGKKLGLVTTEVDVATLNKDILMNTLLNVGILGVIFVAGLVLMLLLIRRRFIYRTLHLVKTIDDYEETKEVALVDEFEDSIHGNDEIATLSRQFVSMVHEVSDHMQRMVRANRQLEVSRKREHEMSELAIRDSLTGIRNKTAYEREVYKIKQDMETGDRRFGIALVDINYLKKINDTYGHDKGNHAIQTICRLVCVTFAHSPVFRIGGDIFIAILKNDDYDAVDALIEQFNKDMNIYSDTPSEDMYEKPAAAVGYALYDDDLDRGSYESVFQRAEDQMKTRKEEMKTPHKNEE